LTPQDIAQGLHAIEEADYLNALKRTTMAKARSLDLNGPDAREERMKLFRHLLSRGFESEIASKAVKEACNPPKP
ncbi:MAG: RecX family transcriptional regulator, partial [Muribaculaceae bacterium]|nr:RecX family transcriptional regulator [Muribaculaceae bacterium]